MTRSILGVKPMQSTLATPVHLSAGNQLSPQSLLARLRQKRSIRYIEAMTLLDAGGHVHSIQSAQTLQKAIQQELPDVTVDALPLGIISKCYLGAPYEVHTLDCSGSIIHHYKVGEGFIGASSLFLAGMRSTRYNSCCNAAMHTLDSRPV